jgi:hypothetical protein
LLGLLLFNPEGESDMFLQNISRLSRDYMVLYLSYSVLFFFFVLQRRAVAAENSVSKLKQELKLVSVSGLNSVCGFKAEYSAVLI